MKSIDEKKLLKIITDYENKLKELGFPTFVVDGLVSYLIHNIGLVVSLELSVLWSKKRRR